MCSFICCGTCCSIYSIFAFLLLIVISAIVEHGGPTIHWDHEKASREKIVDNARIAAYIYLGFLALSIVLFVIGKVRAKKQVDVRQPLLHKVD